MNTEEFSMVQECASSYVVKKHPDGSITISIEVPKRFADLWKVRLSELRTNMKEINEYEPPAVKE